MWAQFYQSWQQFWQQQLWEKRPQGSVTAYGLALIQILVLAWRELWRGGALLRASSLAYTAIMALIPLLALLFAIFKGLGLQRLLATHLVPQLTAGSQEFARQILDYIEGTRVASLGIFGVVWLLVALMILMSNVEEAFNHIWHLPRARLWWRKLADYLSIFLLFPILMAIVATLTSAFQKQPAIQAAIRNFLPPYFFTLYNLLFSFGLVWLGFTFIYLVIPYTRVRLVSALTGGVVAALLWQGAQWIFQLFQTSAPYYNAVYGALYQLLFLVIWIFWSWLIILYGGEVAYVHQHLEQLRQEQLTPSASVPVIGFEFLALGALLYLWQRFQAGHGAVPERELAALFHQQPQITREICQALVSSGFVLPVQTANRLPHYLPSRPLAQLRVREILEKLQRYRWNQAARFLQPSAEITALVAPIALTPTPALPDWTLAEVLAVSQAVS